MKPARKIAKEKKKSILDGWKFDPNAKPIWEELLELSESIPDEEADKIPSDLSERLDEYLYGHED